LDLSAANFTIPQTLIFSDLQIFDLCFFSGPHELDTKIGYVEITKNTLLGSMSSMRQRRYLLGGCLVISRVGVAPVRRSLRNELQKVQIVGSEFFVVSTNYKKARKLTKLVNTYLVVERSKQP
jgi:hypothetical protein